MADGSDVIAFREGDVTTVQFQDRHLVDEGRIAKVQSVLNGKIDEQVRPLLLIDFYNIEAVSSAFLGTLLALHKRAMAKQGRVQMANVQPKLMKIFTLTKLDKVIGISPNRTVARTVLTEAK
jgi:anti-anti-sigma factor